MEDSASKSLSCMWCSATFTRKEHLRRHSQRHTGSSSVFECPLCSKAFGRRDTLLRHLSTHGLSPGDSTSKALPPVVRKRKACTACAKVKKRCNGGDPCSYCLEKHIACHHARRATPREPQVSPSSTTTSMTARTASADPLPLSNENMLSQSTTSIDTIVPEMQQLIGMENGITSIDCWDQGNDLVAPPISQTARQTERSWTDRETAQIVVSDEMASDESISGTVVSSANLSNVFNSFQSWNMSSLGLFDDANFWMMADDDQEDLGFAYANNSNLSSAVSKGDESLAIRRIEDSYDSGDTQIIISGPESHSASTSLESKSIKPSLLTSTRGDYDTCVAENFGHLDSIYPGIYHKILLFAKSQNLSGELTCPSLSALQSFVELYFEYFDSQFPCVHPTYLAQNTSSWMLLLAVATIGCQYSTMINAQQYAKSLLNLLIKALENETLNLSGQPSLPLIQSLFLRDVCLTYSGLKSHFQKVHYERGMLFTMCRALIAQRQVATDKIVDTGGIQEKLADSTWQDWIQEQSRARLIYCITRFEYVQFILFDMRPTLSFNDHEICSLDDKSWQCRSSNEWQAIMASGSQEEAHSISFDGRWASSSSKFSSSFTRQTRLVKLYVEERLTKENLESYLFREIDSSEQNNLDSSSRNSLGAELHRLTTIMGSSMTKAFESFYPQGNIVKHFSDSENEENILPHILLIIRQVPLRVIHAYSGWQADEKEIRKSHNHFTNWAQENPVLARTCLWHAITVLVNCKAKQYVTCSDPLYLIIATLFIWTYDKLVLRHELETASPRNKSPLRIDTRLRSQEVLTWIQEGNRRVHIMGVGVLDGVSSPTRLLKELRKILLSRLGWPGICYALANMMTQVINGQKPDFENE